MCSPQPLPAHCRLTTPLLTTPHCWYRCRQVELHPLLAQRKLVGVSWRKGVVTVAYAPLGSHKAREALDHPVVARIAAEVGKTPGQVRAAQGAAPGWGGVVWLLGCAAGSLGH
jgi:hypothetical protein